MKVVELIEAFKKLGYDDETELDVGAYDEGGDWHNFEFEVEDEDRQFNPDINTIGITLEPSDQYMKSRFETRFDADRIISRITVSINKILSDDDY